MYVQRVGVGEGKICLQPRLGFLHGLLELAELALRLTVWEAYEGGARGGEVVDEVDVVKAGAYAQFVLQILGKALPLLVIDVHHRDDLFLRKASGVCAAQHVDPATITQPDEQATAKATLESGSAFDRPPHLVRLDSKFGGDRSARVGRAGLRYEGFVQALHPQRRELD